MEAMMNAGAFAPPNPSSTSSGPGGAAPSSRNSRRAPAPAPAPAPAATSASAGSHTTGGDDEDKEKRKAEKKRLKEEKKLEKAMMKARMGLQGAAGQGEGDEAEEMDELAEDDAPAPTAGKDVASSASGDKKRKADPTSPASGSKKAKASKKGKEKVGGESAVTVGTAANDGDKSASTSMDDEKLQELANAVLGGGSNATLASSASKGSEAGGSSGSGIGVGVGVVPAFGYSNLDMDDAQFDIAQRVAGIDESAIDPALQQLHDIEAADLEASNLWHATRKANKAAQEAAATLVARGKGKGAAGSKSAAGSNAKGGRAMLLDGGLEEQDNVDEYLQDAGLEHDQNDPFGHAQTHGGITDLISASLLQHQQQQDQQNGHYVADSSSFDYALPADAHAHTLSAAMEVQTDLGADSTPTQTAAPRKRRKAGDPPARRGRPPNPVGPDGEPINASAADGEGASNESATGNATGDRTGFAAPRKPTRTATNAPKGPKDDELVAQFSVAGEMERFLADRWLPSQELIRLEQAGIIAYKKGKFSIEESEAISAYVEEFKKLHRIDGHAFADMVVALGKKADFPRFWNDIAAVVPGRPVRFVQKYVKRVYDPRARQGPWQQDEDKALEQACFANPGQWTKIAAAVGRTEDDCRTRWRDELRHKAERERGRWTKEEEQKLSDIIVRHNLELGKDAHARDAPWESVVKEMGGSRTTMQCRKKWHDQLMFALKKSGGKYVLKKKDRPRLIQAISTKDYAREEHVDFQEIAREEFGMDDYHPLRAMYRRIRAKVPDADEPGLVYSALVARMKAALEVNITPSALNFKSAPTVENVSDDEEEEGDDEGEGQGGEAGVDVGGSGTVGDVLADTVQV